MQYDIRMSIVLIFKLVIMKMKKIFCLLLLCCVALSVVILSTYASDELMDFRSVGIVDIEINYRECMDNIPQS